MTPQVPPLLFVQSQQAFALKEDLPRRDLAAAGQQAQHGADHRGLAGAGLSHDGADLPLLQGEIAVGDGDVFSIGDVDVFDFQ